MEFKQSVFPRWRGFNILGMFCSSESCYNDFRSPGYFIRGKFGIMDNGRTEIEMKSYNGHTLDTEMLKLLQKY